MSYSNSKIFLNLAAVYLIFWDIVAIFSIGAVNAQTIFATVLQNYIPCKSLLGISVLLYANENSALKIFKTITSVFLWVYAIIHTLTLLMQLVLITNGQGATGVQETFNFAGFVGGIFIMVAGIFLMQYFKNGRFTKTTISLSLVAIILFLCYHISDIVFSVMSLTEAGVSGFGAFLVNCLTFGFIVWVVGLIAYLIVFTVPTGVLSETKKDNK